MQPVSWVQERSGNFFAPLNRSQASGHLLVFSEKIWGDLLWNAGVQALELRPEELGTSIPPPGCNMTSPFFCLDLTSELLQASYIFINTPSEEEYTLASEAKLWKTVWCDLQDSTATCWFLIFFFVSFRIN